MGDSEGRVYEKKSVSFRPDQVEAIQRIAAEDKHKRFSRVVQDAVDELIERREQAAEKEPVAA